MSPLDIPSCLCPFCCRDKCFLCLSRAFSFSERTGSSARKWLPGELTSHPCAFWEMTSLWDEFLTTVLWQCVRMLIVPKKDESVKGGLNMMSCSVWTLFPAPSLANCRCLASYWVPDASVFPSVKWGPQEYAWQQVWGFKHSAPHVAHSNPYFTSLSTSVLLLIFLTSNFGRRQLQISAQGISHISRVLMIAWKRWVKSEWHGILFCVGFNIWIYEWRIVRWCDYRVPECCSHTPNSSFTIHWFINLWIYHIINHFSK